MTLAKRRDEQIVVAVVVVVAHRDSKPKHWNREPRFRSHVRERAIVVIAIQLQRGLSTGPARPVLAIDQQNVRPSVVVIINEGATRPQGFREIFFSERAVVVRKPDSSLRGDIAKGDLL